MPSILKKIIGGIEVEIGFEINENNIDVFYVVVDGDSKWNKIPINRKDLDEVYVAVYRSTTLFELQSNIRNIWNGEKIIKTIHNDPDYEIGNLMDCRNCINFHYKNGHLYWCKSVDKGMMDPMAEECYEWE